MVRKRHWQTEEDTKTVRGLELTVYKDCESWVYSGWRRGGLTEICLVRAYRADNIIVFSKIHKDGIRDNGQQNYNVRNSNKILKKQNFTARIVKSGAGTQRVGSPSIKVSETCLDMALLQLDMPWVVGGTKDLHRSLWNYITWIYIIHILFYEPMESS